MFFVFSLSLLNWEPYWRIFAHVYCSAHKVETYPLVLSCGLLNCEATNCQRWGYSFMLRLRQIDLVFHERITRDGDFTANRMYVAAWLNALKDYSEFYMSGTRLTRKVTVEGSKKLPESGGQSSSSGSGTRRSVFDRLGPGTSEVSIRND